MKPTLLLLHGALGSPATLQPLANLLAPDFEVRTLAFSGHGGRPVTPETFTLPYFGQEVNEWLAAHTAGPTHIFGYSMGGYAALLAARRQAAQFASITTLGTKFDWSLESAAVATKFLNPAMIQANVPAFAEQLRQLHAPVEWAAVVEATAQLMQAAGTSPPLSPTDLAALPTPVQVLVGDADTTGSPEASAAWAAHLRQGKLALLPNTPHPLERVDLPDLASRIRLFALASASK